MCVPERDTTEQTTTPNTRASPSILPEQPRVAALALARPHVQCTAVGAVIVAKLLDVADGIHSRSADGPLAAVGVSVWFRSWRFPTRRPPTQVRACHNAPARGERVSLILRILSRLLFGARSIWYAASPIYSLFSFSRSSRHARMASVILLAAWHFSLPPAASKCRQQKRQQRRLQSAVRESSIDQASSPHHTRSALQSVKPRYSIFGRLIGTRFTYAIRLQRGQPRS